MGHLGHRPRVPCLSVDETSGLGRLGARDTVSCDCQTLFTGCHCSQTELWQGKGPPHGAQSMLYAPSRQWFSTLGTGTNSSMDPQARTAMVPAPGLVGQCILLLPLLLLC